VNGFSTLTSPAGSVSAKPERFRVVEVEDALGPVGLGVAGGVFAFATVQDVLFGTAVEGVFAALALQPVVVRATRHAHHTDTTSMSFPLAPFKTWLPGPPLRMSSPDVPTIV
jgi:hypothetical protein